MEHRDIVPRYLREPGVEIGAFTAPIPGIQPVYVDRFAEYAGQRTGAEYFGDACELPFHNDSLRYVATSHVLEHVANPLAALREWHRVLRHGGIIYMVLPDRRKSFDRDRPLTPVTHMLEDFQRGTTQVDATHIDDFVSRVTFAEFWANTPPERERETREQLAEKYHHAVKHGNEINIHFHVFESSVALNLIDVGNHEKIWPGSIDVVEVQENFPSSNPNGFLIVARARKPWHERVSSVFRRRGLRSDARRL